ncbi:helix-turn-helix domain-containing protein [Sinomicrobium sp. M5D2P9]
MKSDKERNSILLFIPFVFFTALSVIFKLHNDVYVEVTRLKFSYLYWFENISLFVFSSCLFYKISGTIKAEKTQNTLKLDENWLNQIKGVSYLLTLLFISFNCYKLVFDFKVEWFSNILKLFTSVYFFWLCFRGISELRIKDERNEITQKLKPASNNPGKRAFSGSGKTSRGNEPEYVRVIDELLNVGKLYRKPDLSREYIAEKIGISPGYLSEIINSNYNQNFSSLVNSYRIKEAMELLQHPEFSKYNIVSVAYEVGFNSKSSFYKAFKKETGTTPSIYLSSQICPDL